MSNAEVEPSNLNFDGLCSLWYMSKLKDVAYILAYNHALPVRLSGLKNKRSTCCWGRNVAGGSGRIWRREVRIRTQYSRRVERVLEPEVGAES